LSQASHSGAGATRRHGTAELAARGACGLDVARALVAAYVPPDAAQAAERARILAFCDAHADALLRTCVPGHLTASALVVDARGERALMTHHRKLDRWLQLGGHVDGDGHLARSALREACEESGIPDLLVEPEPFDLDVHTIPARRTRDGVLEPEHLHLDVRFVVHAPPGAREVVSDESHALAWVAPQDLARHVADESVRRLFRRFFGTQRVPSEVHGT
jgi:8-oxo-dGTP pyrophosphatase MutT (NUDIX family)